MQRIDSIAGNPHVSIAPSYEIVVPDVHPSRIPYLSVYDHYLPVVSVVELRAEPEKREFRIRELHDLDSCLLHFVVVSRSDLDIRDILVYEPYLDPFTGLFHKQFPYPFASIILLEIEIFHMDVMPGVEDVVHQGIEFAPS